MAPHPSSYPRAAARREAANALCARRVALTGALVLISGAAILFSGAALRGGSAPLRGVPPGMTPAGLLRLLPSELPPPMVKERLALTGHPPLTCRSDLSRDGNPDFEQKDVPQEMKRSFHHVDSASVRGADDVFRYVTVAEDAIKDVVVATLASGGKQRTGESRTSCKASPVTARWWCASSVRAVAREAKTPPRPLWLLDAGNTAGGYYGLLAAAFGIHALLVDPQPQCAMWAAQGAAASGTSHLLTSVVALPGSARADAHGASVPVRLRTGCVGSSSIDWPPSLAETARAYDGPPAGRALVNVSVRSLDRIVEDPASGVPRDALFLVLKMDASGREAEALLDGAAGLLASGRVLSVLLELNKQHGARREAEGGEPGDVPRSLLGEGGYDAAPAPRSAVHISDELNARLAARVARTARAMLAHGYHMLTADRGWWSAQDPFSAATDAADPALIDAWALKLMGRGEVDVWFWLPDTQGADLPWGS